MMWIIWNDLFARSSLSAGDFCVMNKDSDIEVAVQWMLVCRYDNIVKQIDNFSRFWLPLSLWETRLYNKVTVRKFEFWFQSGYIEVNALQESGDWFNI